MVVGEEAIVLIELEEKGKGGRFYRIEQLCESNKDVSCSQSNGIYIHSLYEDKSMLCNTGFLESAARPKWQVCRVIKIW